MEAVDLPRPQLLLRDSRPPPPRPPMSLRAPPRDEDTPYVAHAAAAAGPPQWASCQPPVAPAAAAAGPPQWASWQQLVAPAAAAAGPPQRDDEPPAAGMSPQWVEKPCSSEPALPRDTAPVDAAPDSDDAHLAAQSCAQLKVRMAGLCDVSADPPLPCGRSSSTSDEANLATHVAMASALLADSAGDSCFSPAAPAAQSHVDQTTKHDTGVADDCRLHPSVGSVGSPCDYGKPASESDGNSDERDLAEAMIETRLIADFVVKYQVARPHTVVSSLSLIHI